MLEGLSQRFEGVVKRLQGLHKLTEENVSDAMREVRIALLEADVNISVVKDFIANVKSLALGMETIPGVQPGQQIVKIVHENLIQVLGGDTANLNLTGRGSTVILMTGLQGSGKTTTTAKLAAMLKKQGYRPLMVSADVYRPAAIEQLGVLGEQIDVPTIKTTTDMNPEEIGRAALEEMTQLNANVLLVDTAGRLAIDEQMMNELSKLKDILQPKEILFVADSMTGQDAVNTARAFNEQIGMTGVILTKMDGDIRGGAALSIKKVTGTPIKFIGVGEKTSQFEQFHPDRIAGRILGMGDVLSLVEKAQENISQKDAEKQANKVLTATFNLSDFLQQLKMVRDMGPLDQLMKMIPGLGGALKDAELDEYELIRTEAIINSMTMKERGLPSGFICTGTQSR